MFSLNKFVCCRHRAAKTKRQNVVRQQGHRQQQRGNAVPLAMAVEAADSNGGGGMTEMIVVQTEEGEDEEGGTTTKTVQLQVDESGHVTFKTE